MKTLLTIFCVLTMLSTTPTNQAYNIITETPNGGGCVGYCYNQGDGEYRMLIVNPYHPVNIVPSDGSFIYYDGAGNYDTGYDLGDGNRIVWIDIGEDHGKQLCNFICNVPQFPLHIKIVEFNYDFDSDYVYFLTSNSINNPAVLQ